MNRKAFNPKLWLKNRLERVLLSWPFVAYEVLQKNSLAQPQKELQIIIPHRVNWRLTNSTVRAFQRLTTGNFGLTVVVNFDEVPEQWEGLHNPRLTLLRYRFTFLGQLLRLFFSSENGSMSNAMAIELGLKEEPDFRWALVAHNDSAPLRKGWNEQFFQALGSGLVIGNTRDTSRVCAAHAAGTLFDAHAFRKRGGTPWPIFRFGEMVQDVGDGISEALHPKNVGLVPVLPNTRQSPALISVLKKNYPLLAEFAHNGTQVSFAPDGETPIYAHMGRGTPRSQLDPSMAHKLPVDRWIEWIDSIDG